jgi:hypothetical protein
MGGQACILYGAAEFTRDSDFLVDGTEANLQRLHAALSELDARPVYVPTLSADVLRRGHACHFRCGAPGLDDWRIDVMGRLRGCDPFAELWQRRNCQRLPKRGAINLLSVEDLVRAKKTQRDKDWPMIARLVEADYLKTRRRPTRRKIEFWLMQARTPELLARLVRRFPAAGARLAAARPAVARALRGDVQQVERALQREQRREREADRAYWAPLRAELRGWRQARRKPHRG